MDLGQLSHGRRAHIEPAIDAQLQCVLFPNPPDATRIAGVVKSSDRNRSTDLADDRKAAIALWPAAA